AAYIEDHLRAWGVRPAGDNGSYLQTVRVLGIKTTGHSTLTVEVGGEARTFADGQGITFPKNVGGKRRVTIDRVEFVGYGLDAPAAGHEDFHDKQGPKDVKGAAVVWLGAKGPREVDSSYGRLLSRRNRYATEQLGAAASIGVPAPQGPGRGTERRDAAADERDTQDTAPPASNRAGRGRIPPADFTTVQRLDAPIAPNVTASDALFKCLLSREPAKYEELKRKADAQDPLPSFHLEGVRLIFDLNADYAVVRTQLAHNVVASIEGADPQLRNTYVAFGAHYDHVGYAE